MHAELLDRLDGAELDDDIDHRPVDEIIADICRDLGIATMAGAASPWKRRTPEDVVELCARAAVGWAGRVLPMACGAMEGGRAGSDAVAGVGGARRRHCSTLLRGP